MAKLEKPVFQKSVLRKYLASQDADACKAAYDLYVAHFHDPRMQAEIRKMNEEEYQDGFLEHLFVNILGYTKRPFEGYNLIREKKNETDGKKADGAILRPDGSVIAVIELKGAKIKDLDKIDDQAWGYQRSHIDCSFVITSNFEKLRLYFGNQVEREQFDLFKLTEERFSVMWLCLQKDNLLGGIPQRIKEDSVLEEEAITQELYKDYSAFKSDLWQDMCRNNSEANELELYMKSQKLLDRFLFIFFAEDKGLLPPNTISTSVSKWEKLAALDYPQPLYNIFKQLFGFINTGRSSNTDTEDIFAYNGGLFRPDEVLDDLVISDDVLKKHVLKLTAYDFNDKVDTDILGHIFEHSLNDIENVRAQLAGEEVDKRKTKRKKDGVFYTPKYVTKYIIDNTVGKLCDEKKQELGISEEAISPDFVKKGGKLSAKGKAFNKMLTDYRQWLLDLKIIDPACGSGAFLNQTLEFLISEHDYLESLVLQLQRLMQGGGNQISADVRDVQNEILENNIFGVDINEESVEIARLSLWLRTAQKGRTLTSLSNNIKCGNSLIDDSDVAGELAFNWHEQFPEVFDQGGFDVVIGNPPYVVYLKSTIGENSLDFLNSRFSFAEYNPNAYALFTELGLNYLLRPKGKLGFIIPNSWMTGDYFTKMRQGVYNSQIEEVDYLKDEVFTEVVETVVLLLTNFPSSPNTIRFSEDLSQPPVIADFEKSKFIAGYNPFTAQENPIVARIENTSQVLGDVAIVYRGLETKNNKVWLSESKDTDLHVPILLGRDVHRYSHAHSGTYVKFIKHEMKSNANEDMYNQPKVLMRRTGATIIADLDFSNLLALKNLYVITPKDNSTVHSIVAQLNSKLFAFIHFMRTSAENKAFAQFPGTYIAKFPYRELPVEVVDLVERMRSASSQRSNFIHEFIELLQSKFPIDKPSRKLLDWPGLDFKGFLDELEKKKIQLTLEEKGEWLSYFNKKKTEANALNAEIRSINRQIDQMVYELYELSEEEINRVETC